MTDEVGRLLVLADNEDQNDLMGTSRQRAQPAARARPEIKDFVAERGLNRELEALPSEKEIGGEPKPGWA